MQRGLLSTLELNIFLKALRNVIQVRVRELSYVIHVLPRPEKLKSLGRRQRINTSFMI